MKITKLLSLSLLLASAACRTGDAGKVPSSSESEAKDAAVASAEALGAAADAVDLAESVSGGPAFAPAMPPPPGGPGPGSPLACDPEPDVTLGDTCGHPYPATVHLEWTDCVGPNGGSSSGIIDLVNVASVEGTCDAPTAFLWQQDSTFALDFNAPDGRSASEDGAASSTASHDVGVPAGTKVGTLDATRTFRDENGDIVRQVNVAGDYDIAYDGVSDPPTRTFNGTLQAELVNENKTLDLEVTGLVRVPPPMCIHPVAGTIVATRTEGNTTITHTIAFGPQCGQAAVDGNPIMLPPPM